MPASLRPHSHRGEPGLLGDLAGDVAGEIEASVDDVARSGVPAGK